MIQLSILIPSIPSRFDKAYALFNSLQEMAEGKHIEILMLTDNKKRSIGAKCNDLKRASKGKFFCFIHDDDELISLDEIYAATFQNVDVIDFKAECRNEDGSTYIVTQKLGNLVEHNVDEETGRYLDMNRPPFPNCAWRNWFKHFNFEDISYSEDWTFVEKSLPNAKTEFFIDKVLFKYNFDPKITEANTESNTHWTNPNNHEGSS